MSSNQFKNRHTSINSEENLQYYQISEHDSIPNFPNNQNDELDWYTLFNESIYKRTLLSPQSSVSKVYDEANSSFHLDNEQQNIIRKKIIKNNSLPMRGDKNSGKNICRALKCYIFSNFSFQQRQTEPLKRFLALKPEQTGLIKLLSFLNTHKGYQIGQQFLGNYRWGKYFIETNKIDITKMFGDRNTKLN